MNSLLIKYLLKLKPVALLIKVVFVLPVALVIIGCSRGSFEGLSKKEKMDSFSSPSSGSSSKFSADDLMQQLKVQFAQAYAEEFLETVRGKCFDKCITKPGSSLSGGEASCVSRCVERYIEATGIVGRSLFSQH